MSCWRRQGNRMVASPLISRLLVRRCRLLLVLFLLLAGPAYAGATGLPESWNSVIEQSRQEPDVSARIAYLSARFLDVPYRLRYLRDHYSEVAGEPALGDIMTFYNVHQEPVHACVYVAGDVVFTKNGATLFSPWVLMAYQDMLAYYSMDGQLTLRILHPRRRPEGRPLPPA